MSAAVMILRTLSEIAVVLVLLFGFLKENKILQWQRRAFRLLHSLRKKARAAREREMQQELLEAQYADEYETERSSKTAARTKAETKKRKASRGKVA